MIDMKSGGGGGVGSAYGYAAKRRWRGLAIGVLGLVILSMLVPLVFLLGLHNGFHSPGNQLILAAITLVAICLILPFRT